MDPNIAQIILQERRIAYILADPDLKVIELDGFADITGEDLGASLGRRLPEVVPELFGCEAILTDILAGKLPRFHLAWIQRDMADGRTMYLTMVNLPYRNADGDIVGLIHVIEDVTEMGNIEQRMIQQHNELRLLQTQLARHNRELASANVQLAHAARAKNEFLASMSHELRTPLTAILGLSESLQSGDYGPLIDKQHQSIQRIEESGRHLLALINDILDVAKIEAGRLDLEIGPVVVSDVCEASLRMVTQAAYKQRLHVSTALDSSVTLIQADARRLKQILVNLLSNAVKFTPEGGTIGLEVHGDKERHVAHFTVWDTGIGIEHEHLEQLFHPFVQLDSRLSRQYNGTGLGLTLTHRLTDLHGGGLAVESVPGAGSRFTVSLPWHDHDFHISDNVQNASVINVCEPEYTVCSPAPLVLVVEDNEHTASMLTDYLQSRGYRVSVARNGEEVLQRARADQPEVILMDIQMPGMDGLEATQRLRADSVLKTVPIIALTALTMAGDRERCIEAGVNDYLSKPINFKALFRAIEARLPANQVAVGNTE